MGLTAEQIREALAAGVTTPVGITVSKRIADAMRFPRRLPVHTAMWIPPSRWRLPCRKAGSGCNETTDKDGITLASVPSARRSS